MGTITIGRNEYNVEERSMYQQEIIWISCLGLLTKKKVELNIWH